MKAREFTKEVKGRDAASRLDRSLQRIGINLAGGEKYYQDKKRQSIEKEKEYKSQGIIAVTAQDVHDIADEKGIPWDNEPRFLELSKKITGTEHLDDMDQRQLVKIYNHLYNLDSKFAEAWSQKYKRSINCSNPKGFSQRAHCQGRKKNEDVDVKEKLSRTGSRELVIFDIDDTLLHTTAMIKVINKNTGEEKSLTNQQFNNYKLAKDEEFDFGEFRNARKFEEESVPIGPMLNKLRADLNAGKNVVMLTARADFDDQPAVYRTFKRYGIDINNDVHLYRAGNLPGEGSPAAKKAIHVSKWLSTGNFNKITMYDDSEKNLYAFKFLEKKFPDVEFEAHHVSHEGDTTQVENQLDELNIPQTLNLIQQAHGDQRYGELPYWRHPRAVAMTGKKIFGNRFNSDAVKVAFLHDVVEDTSTTLDDLRKFDFAPEVIEAVGLLTKDKTIGYSQNIERIINSGNELAMMVKYADNYENWTGDKRDWAPERAAKSQAKYLASLNMLGDKLGVKHHIKQDMTEGFTQSHADANKIKKQKSGAIGHGLGWKDYGDNYRELVKDIVNKFDNITRLVQYDQAPEPTKYKIVERFFKKYGYPFELFNDVITGIERRIAGETSKYSQEGVAENFADGRNPQDKGDSKRLGIPKKASLATLDKIGKGSGRKAQLSRWQANMRRGRAK